MNKVFFIGNLTRDPELKQTASGVSVCRFSIAVQRQYSSQDGEHQTDFFECTAWRGLGESIAKYAKKGKKVAVGGSIQLRNYEDNQGVKRTAVDIIVQDCEFLSPKDNAESDAPRTSRNKPTLQPMDGDDDIPF
jgi:single-strand DNA-binding protein